MNRDNINIKPEQLLTDEMSELIPFINSKRIDKILGSLAFYCEKHDKKFKAILDLDQIQAGQYQKLKKFNSEEQKIVDDVINKSNIDSRTLIYLSLRSMFTLVWDQFETVEDIKVVLELETMFSRILIENSKEIADEYKEISFYPYWARLNLLQLLSQLNLNNPEFEILNNLTCCILPSKDLNANLFSLPEGSIIGLDYALDPLLKFFNTFVLHYYSTKDYAGPCRISRAFNDILPFILYFIYDLSIHKFQYQVPLFNIDIATTSKSFTYHQVTFLVAHEIGHLVLNHHGKSNSFHFNSKTSDLEAKIINRDHFLEFEADIFGLNFFRSKVLNEMRYNLNRKNLKDKKDKERLKLIDTTLNTQFESIQSVRCLFLIMSFIERSVDYILQITNGNMPIKTHPSALNRLNRLKLIDSFDIPVKEGIELYYEEFLGLIHDFLKEKPVEDLIEQINAIKTNYK